MDINPIGVAVPFFLLLIGIEWLVLRKQKKDVRINDAITDMSCGLGDQTISLLAKSTVLIPYVALQTHYGAARWAMDSVWTWVIGFIVTDFCFYWYHRFSHRVNLGWATHAVHHQSEEYNLSVALRQPWFSVFYNWIFYLPLAFLGLPVEVYATSLAFNLLYQFWIHTETIRRLGAFEWVFNSPSHHRVHHGTNPDYIDKNYAGVLIIWDRLFGTFQDEHEQVLYGTLKPLRSWNPIWANVGPWVYLSKLSASQASFVDGLKVWFMPPEWTPDGPIDPKTLFAGDDRGYNVDKASKLHGYILLNLILTGTILGVLLTFEKSIGVQHQIVGAVFVVLSLSVWAGLFEGRKWAWPLEVVRLIYGVCAASTLFLI
ncbi:MAG: sterol desaturase family protein [Myxococcota bacterium]|nr:sterol desaturase family protein [Myxococcota bacterium]